MSAKILSLFAVIILGAAMFVFFNQPVSYSILQPEKLSLTLLLDKQIFCPSEYIHGVAVLKNIGRRDTLVDGRWYFMPHQVPPILSSGYLRLWDPSGVEFYLGDKIDRDLVSEDDFVLLGPGEILEKTVEIEMMYYRELFSSSGKYLLAVYYQNELDITKKYKGVDVHAWTGEIGAASEFQISSGACGTP